MELPACTAFLNFNRMQDVAMDTRGWQEPWRAYFRYTQKHDDPIFTLEVRASTAILFFEGIKLWKFHTCVGEVRKVLHDEFSRLYMRERLIE